MSDTSLGLGKCLMEYLKRHGLDEYGSVILASDVRAVLGLEVPEIGTQKQFRDLALAELGAVDYCRNILLGRGKYLTQRDGDYRILLPSENARQVESYMSQADKKLKRALKLTRGAPHLDNHAPDNTAVRILMKRESIRNRADFGSNAS